MSENTSATTAITDLETLALVEAILDQSNGGAGLNDIQALVLQQSLQGQSYQQIADQAGYECDYMKQIGAQLWKALSQATGKTVTKKNIHSVLRHYRQSQGTPSPKSATITASWGEAVDVSTFFGRETELSTLEQWIASDRSRLVAVLGMGGIGKTTVGIKLAEQLQPGFECLVWRSLRHAPPFPELIAECILFISNQQEANIPEDTHSQISLLMQYLKKRRCLIILDNLESILQTGKRAGGYCEGYEGYGQLLERAADESHQSCILITSREKPAGISVREGETVRSLQLTGVSSQVGQEILGTKGLAASKDACDQMVERYSGNPLALKIAAATTKALFERNVSAFLKQGTTVFGDIWDLLDQQFQRLSNLEQQVMRWLATNREWTTLAELREDIVPVVSHRALLEAVESLKARSLLESSAQGFTQQPVVMEYMTERLVEQFYQGLKMQNTSSLRQHVLIKAQTKDYIRDAQVRQVLKPTIVKLQADCHTRSEVINKLEQLLDDLRGKNTDEVGYAGGNLINILRCLDVDLSGFDLSKQILRQAYLPESDLSQVNLAQAHISNSVFASSFGSILSVACSPDAQMLAMGDAKGNLCLFQGHLREPKVILSGHTSMIWSVAFSPCSQVIASASNDGTIKLWCCATGKCLQTLINHYIGVLCIAFSYDGNQIASGGNNGQVKIWSVQTGDCLQNLSADSDQIWSVAFAHGEHLLATGGSDGVIKLWTLKTGKCLQTLKGHTGCIYSLTFSTDGQTLVSGSGDQTIKLWDTYTYDCQQTLFGHNHQVSTVKWIAHEQALVSCSHDQTIRLWDSKTGECLHIFQGHKNWVSDIALSADSQILISCSEDQTVKYWDVRTRKCLKTLRGQGNQVWSLAFSPDGHMLASGDENLRLWDLTTGEHLKCLRGHFSRVMSVSFSPNGQLLASSSRDGTTKIWDIESVSCIQTFLGSSIVRGAIFSPDNHFLVNTHFDNSISLWNLETNQCLRKFYGHQGWTLNAKFHPDGSLLASGSMDRTIKFWDISTGECLNTIEKHKSWIVDLDFNKEGNLLASGSDDQNVKLWDIKTGVCLETFEGHQNTVSAVMFHPDRTLLVSASHDKTVRLWDIDSGECLKTLEGHKDAIWSVAFSPDGKLIASGGQDRTIRIWDVNTGDCLKILEAPRPYEGMNITDVTGLTDAQKMTLKELGAVELA